MTRIGIYEQIKTAFQDIIAPELHALRGDIRLPDQKIAGLDQKIDGVDVRLTVKIDGLRTEMGSLRTELLAEIRRVDTRIDGVDSKIDGLDHQLRTAIDVRERLAALEARRPSDRSAASVS